MRIRNPLIELDEIQCLAFYTVSSFDHIDKLVWKSPFKFKSGQADVVASCSVIFEFQGKIVSLYSELANSYGVDLAPTTKSGNKFSSISIRFFVCLSSNVEQTIYTCLHSD